MYKFDWISVYIYWVLCRQEVEVSGNGNQFWSSLFPIAFPFPTKHRDPWQIFFFGKPATVSQIFMGITMTVY